MGIVTEKKFLTQEEIQSLKSIQLQTQSLVLELGEIEMVKLQLENRYQLAKQTLNDLSNQEQTFTQNVFETYGKCSINPETGEITNLD
jgi:succinylglutamate desuccinylase